MHPACKASERPTCSRLPPPLRASPAAMAQAASLYVSGGRSGAGLMSGDLAYRAGRPLKVESGRFCRQGRRLADRERRRGADGMCRCRGDGPGTALAARAATVNA